ncbi:MAG: 4-hydroxy-tetrahydrodipicolinate reductase [Synergistes sp.]|nr:4-hydroxy-tetrahydrodipicolinate reductase [Synergistes sp.]
MMKVILHGYSGHMGLEVRRAAEKSQDVEIVCGVDAMTDGTDAKCVKSFGECNAEADCIIDFSHHSLTGDLAAFAVEKKLPLIIATTGQTEYEKNIIAEAAKQVPVFMASNFSLGIAAETDLIKRAAALFPDADIEIVETHHNRKIDAPSGTALSLFAALKEVRADANAVCGRSENGKREKNDIGIHALRMGNYVGVHEVVISTDNESLTIRHQAFSRAVFADGAIQIVPFIVKKAPGLYGMKDFLEAND